MQVRRSLLALALVAGAVLIAAPLAAAQEKVPFKVEGELKADDPKDKKLGTPSKSYEVTLDEGKTYKIDLTGMFDTFLRLESPEGKEVAFNDDIDLANKNLNSRIIYPSPKAGKYRVIVTGFEGQVGKYTLEVVETKGGGDAPKQPKLDGLQSRLKDLLTATVDEGRKILAEVEKAFSDKKDKLSLQDAGLLFQVANAVEFRNKDLAADTYGVVGKILSASDNPKLVEAGKMLQGAARRVGLVGKELDVRGTTIEGKEFDWKSYRGKVILVDFWATWCGPCIKELPNVRKVYDDFKAKGFEVVGISVDRDREELDEFLKKEKLPWVTIHDKGGDKGAPSMADYYGVLSIPQAILVGRDGRVISLHARGEELRRLVETALGGDKK